MIIPPIPVSNLASLLAAQAVAAKVAAYAPVLADSGRETWFEGKGAVVCLDAESWNAVWDRHIKNEAIGNQRIGNLNPAPNVDFRKDYVLALFAGPTRGIVGYRPVSGFSLGKQAVLRLVPILDTSRGSAIALPNPWAFLVLPRIGATVSVQVPAADGTWSVVTKVPPSL